MHPGVFHKKSLSLTLFFSYLERVAGAGQHSRFSILSTGYTAPAESVVAHMLLVEHKRFSVLNHLSFAY